MVRFDFRPSEKCSSLLVCLEGYGCAKKVKCAAIFTNTISLYKNIILVIILILNDLLKIVECQHKYLRKMGLVEIQYCSLLKIVECQY